jgi:integrase
VSAPALERPTLAELRGIVDDAADKSHAENTKNTYAKSLRALEAFCAPHGLTPFPTTTEVLGLWAADQAWQRLAPSTIKTRASAIRSLHRRPELAGLPKPAEPYVQPDLDEVEKVVRTLSRDLAKKGWKPNRAEAMLLVDLRRIKANMAPKGVLRKGIDLRDWAILTLGFAMGARRSELSCLNIEDVALDPDDSQWLMVRICSSKTDQEGNGEVVMIKRAGDHTVCPVAAVFDWLTWLKMHGATRGPLLRQLAGNGDTLTTSGMATTPEGLEGRMSGKAISLRYSVRSLRAQIPGFAGRLKRFTGHSGRRGGATEAAKRGATHIQMCSHFRWSAGSRMALEYVDLADKRENNPMAAVM